MIANALLQKLKAALGWTAPPPEPRMIHDGPSWDFANVWNQSLVVRKERPMVPRDYVWASEIGGGMLDRYLKMGGVQPSNAPNNRSLRKFQAGDIWEWLCALVLKRAGILVEQQTRLSYQYPGLLRVSGKLDFLAGGQPDWRKARKELSFLGLPEMLENASLAIIDSLEKQFGNDALKTIVLEIKSCSTFMYAKYDRSQQPGVNHRSQAFHYLKSLGMNEAHIVYVCRDDCMLLEFPILNPSLVEGEYVADLTEITGYVLNKERPQLEQEILFDEKLFRFEKNWKIEYSNYLTMLYGFKTPMEYREKVDKSISDMNRVFKRCVTNAKMTDLNVQVIANAKRAFPAWDDLVDRAREAAKKDPNLISTEEPAFA